MPKEGYTTITVTQTTHDFLKEFAKKTHRSIPQVVELLAEKAKEDSSREANPNE